MCQQFKTHFPADSLVLMVTQTSVSLDWYAEFNRVKPSHWVIVYFVLRLLLTYIENTKREQNLEYSPKFENHNIEKIPSIASPTFWNIEHWGKLLSDPSGCAEKISAFLWLTVTSKWFSEVSLIEIVKLQYVLISKACFNDSLPAFMHGQKRTVLCMHSSLSIHSWSPTN